MQQTLTRIVYISRDAIPEDDHQLSQQIEQILSCSQETNAQAGITGALLFNRGRFAQVLEGPPAVVDLAYSRISQDTRHTDVTLLLREPVEQRSYGQWSMAYISAEALLPLTPDADALNHELSRQKAREARIIHEVLQDMLLGNSHAA